MTTTKKIRPAAPATPPAPFNQPLGPLQPNPAAPGKSPGKKVP